MNPITLLNQQKISDLMTRPWGILSSIVILWMWGIAFIVEAFNFNESRMFFFAFLVGMLFLITSIGLHTQDALAWWITFFTVFATPILALFIFTESSYIVNIIEGIISGMLLLFGLTHRETIEAMHLGIKYKGWIVEE